MSALVFSIGLLLVFLGVLISVGYAPYIGIFVAFFGGVFIGMEGARYLIDRYM